MVKHISPGYRVAEKDSQAGSLALAPHSIISTGLPPGMPGPLLPSCALVPIVTHTSASLSPWDPGELWQLHGDPRNLVPTTGCLSRIHPPWGAVPVINT